MHTLRRVNRIILGCCIIVMSVAVGLGVISRYIFGQPLLWTDEIARAGMVWLTFVGAAQLFSYENGHLKLTFLTDRLAPAVQRLLAIVANLVELVLVLVVGVGTLVFIYFNSDAVTSALELPVYVIYGIIPLTTMIAAFFVVTKLVAYFAGKTPDLVAPASGEDHG